MLDEHSSSFKTYMWTKADSIGAGATSNVYKAICQVDIRSLIFVAFIVVKFLNSRRLANMLLLKCSTIKRERARVKFSYAS